MKLKPMLYKHSLKYTFLILAFTHSEIQAYEPPLTGYIKVIDVDTFDIQGRRIRILGIDGAGINDRGQTDLIKSFAHQSTQYLIEKTKNRKIICYPTGKKSGNRLIGKCYFQDNQTDLAKTIVLDGYAVDWPKYSNCEYQKSMKIARLQKKGIWQRVPESWRGTCKNKL